ncbi:MAG: MATE family efflux transporter [Lachnospiraceae bacterium]|nr:MATE family efflux transporter [Lachnospiraceae bacterium]
MNIPGFKKIRPGLLRQLFVLVFPIVIQNLITTGVSLVDVVMLGRLDQSSLSAASLAGQVMFLLNIVYFGLSSAVTILASQYWGKRDRETVAKILGLGLYIGMFFSTLAFALALICPTAVMRIWTNDPELVTEGAKYLRYAAFSYFFAGITQPYLSLMKSCERVKLSMLVSSLTLFINISLNAVLIFGLLGMPRLGIIGAAVATSISRFIEFVICAVDYFRQSLIPRGFKVTFAIPRVLAGDFARYSLPAFLNDAIWGLAFNMNSIVMGHLNSDIVAANSMVTVVRDFVSVTGFGISAGASILLGIEIGEHKEEQARSDAASILKLTFLVGILQGLVLLVITPFIPPLAKISDTAKQYLVIMLLISTVYQIGQIVNTLLIAALFRCGGDSRYGLILDIVTMWFVAVPLGLVSAFVLKLPPIIVYAITCTDEFIKMPFALHHYKKKNWIKNLTREMN